jgi:pimeloyl-ACP methyl ester carboxylesterase
MSMAPRGDKSRIAQGFGLVTGMTALAVGAVAAGFELERRLVGSMLGKTRPPLPAKEPFFTLRATGPKVITKDGVKLHVEVDQPDPGVNPGVTIVMVHGYVLSLHCWHFQRKHFRGRHKIVLYDQRSHGRSGRSPAKRCRLRFLARDLKQVLDATTEPDEPVVLMGHSMGGMIIQEFARRYSSLIGTKVLGVALLNTSSGDLQYHSIVKGIPGEVFPRIAEPLMVALNRIPTVVEKSRKASTDVTYVVTRRLGYGSNDVPAEYVDFLSEMVSATPLDVVADYYPSFSEHDGVKGIGLLSRIETTVIGGEEDQIVPIEHTHRILEKLPGADSLILPRSAHMGLIQHHEEYNAALQRLVDRAERHLLDSHQAVQALG